MFTSWQSMRQLSSTFFAMRSRSLSDGATDGGTNGPRLFKSRAASRATAARDLYGSKPSTRAGGRLNAGNFSLPAPAVGAALAPSPAREDGSVTTARAPDAPGEPDAPAAAAPEAGAAPLDAALGALAPVVAGAEAGAATGAADGVAAALDDGAAWVSTGAVGAGDATGAAVGAGVATGAAGAATGGVGVAAATGGTGATGATGAAVGGSAGATVGATTGAAFAGSAAATGAGAGVTGAGGCVGCATGGGVIAFGSGAASFTSGFAGGASTTGVGGTSGTGCGATGAGTGVFCSALVGFTSSASFGTGAGTGLGSGRTSTFATGGGVSTGRSTGGGGTGNSAFGLGVSRSSARGIFGGETTCTLATFGRTARVIGPATLCCTTGAGAAFGAGSTRGSRRALMRTLVSLTASLAGARKPKLSPPTCTIMNPKCTSADTPSAHSKPRCALTAMSWATARVSVMAAAFIAMGLWILVPDKLDEDDVAVPKQQMGVFFATLFAFFLAEMGDKTQFATIALGAQYQSVLMVVLGTTLGMMLANAPAVYLGHRFADRLPTKLVHSIAAVIFVAIGVWTLAKMLF